MYCTPIIWNVIQCTRAFSKCRTILRSKSLRFISGPNKTSRQKFLQLFVYNECFYQEKSSDKLIRISIWIQYQLYRDARVPTRCYAIVIRNTHFVLFIETDDKFSIFIGSCYIFYTIGTLYRFVINSLYRIRFIYFLFFIPLKLRKRKAR